eukprot:2337895-Pyramimonas_sp.AAC.1
MARGHKGGAQEQGSPGGQGRASIPSWARPKGWETPGPDYIVRWHTVAGALWVTVATAER